MQRAVEIFLLPIGRAEKARVRERPHSTSLKSLTASEHSLMPAGLEAAMKPQDLADLLSFLKGGAQSWAGASSFGVKSENSKVGRWAPRSGAAMSRRATTFGTRLRRAQRATSNVQRLTFNEGRRWKSARHHTALAYNASSSLSSKIP
jgi:hypothetical protein